MKRKKAKSIKKINKSVTIEDFQWGSENIDFSYNQKTNEKIYSKEKLRFKSFYDYVVYSYQQKNGYKKTKAEIKEHFQNVISRAQRWNEKINKIQKAANNSSKKIESMTETEFKTFLEKNKHEGKTLEITKEDRIDMYWYQAYQSFKQAKPASSIMYVTDFKKNGITDKKANNLFSRLLMGEDLFKKVKGGLEIPDKGIARNLRAIGDFFKAISNKILKPKKKAPYEETYARQSSHYKNIRIHHGWDFSKENTKLTGIGNNVMCYGQFKSEEKNKKETLSGGAVYSKPESHGANPDNFEEFAAHGLNFLKGDKGKGGLAKQREVDINPEIAEDYFKFVTQVFQAVSKTNSDILFIPKKKSPFGGAFLGKNEKLIENICKKSGVWSKGSNDVSIFKGELSKNKSNAQLIIKKKTDMDKIDKFLKYAEKEFIPKIKKKLSKDEYDTLSESFNEFVIRLDLYKQQFEGGFLPQGSEIVINNSESLYQKDKQELKRIEALTNTAAPKHLSNNTSRTHYKKKLKAENESYNQPVVTKKQKVSKGLLKKIKVLDKKSLIIKPKGKDSIKTKKDKVKDISLSTTKKKKGILKRKKF